MSEELMQRMQNYVVWFRNGKIISYLFASNKDNEIKNHFEKLKCCQPINKLKMEHFQWCINLWHFDETEYKFKISVMSDKSEISLQIFLIKKLFN